MTLKLGVPSKGRLQAQTVDWFAARGVGIALTGTDREYAGRVDGVDGVQLVLLAAGEIPRELVAGRIHMGVTGQDVVAERVTDGRVVELAEMGFGRADLVVAVPRFWIDVDGMDDLDAAAAAFRAAHGHRFRVATKYHNLARGWFQKHDMADYHLIDSQGATEGTIANGTAEAIVDITSSGDTLRANHLKILSDGPILQSQAALFASRRADWSLAAQAAYGSFAQRLAVSPPDPPWASAP
ncbi:MAG: ATP phosphoribosyltransferase [Pseudomonadota bacterium]